MKLTLEILEGQHDLSTRKDLNGDVDRTLAGRSYKVQRDPNDELTDCVVFGLNATKYMVEVPGDVLRPGANGDVF